MKLQSKYDPGHTKHIIIDGISVPVTITQVYFYYDGEDQTVEYGVEWDEYEQVTKYEAGNKAVTADELID